MSLDIYRFWSDDAAAHEDNCFSADSPQVALGIRMSDECIFAELGEEGDLWGELPREQRIEFNKRYNDKAEKIVGKRLLREYYPLPEMRLPAFKQIGEVFGGEYQYHSKGGVWLKQNCEDPDELEKILDKIDRMDIRSFILPQNWDSEKKRIFETYGIKPDLYASVRGPVTLACSIFGVENLIYLYYDNPDLFRRFSQTILRVIIEYIEIFSQESGKAPCGFSFYDDDCCLLTPEMYEAFGYPVLKAIFDMTSPYENDRRFQHSDSAMGHLLPILARLNLTGCNFGPTLTVKEIRAAMPHTRIDGQLAPYTFMRDDHKAIAFEVKRDCEMAIESGIKGLNIFTAGSINNGSTLEGLRVIMETIQTYGRY